MWVTGRGDRPALHTPKEGPRQGQAQSAVKMRLEMSSRSQSMPTRRFCPVTALQAWMHQWWLLILSSSRAW